MTQFYSQLSYSVGNEDWLTEQKALKIGPSDHVFSITASGDRPLNLLMSNCKRVVSVDANPMQTALCELKKAALASLEYDEYLEFLGLSPTNDRMKLLQKLENRMPKAAKRLWQIHSDKIEKGIFYQGNLEKKLQIVAKITHMLASKVIDGLYELESLEEQRTFVEKNWKGAKWQRAFEMVLNPFVRKFLLKDPGLYAYVNIPISPPLYLYKRMESSLHRFPVKENILFSLLFQGRLYEEAFSPHLTKLGAHEIAKRVDRLHCHTADAVAYLEQAEPASFDCFSLSDIASYMTKESFERLSRAIFNCAKDGARFCIREFMSSQRFPEDLAPYFVRDAVLEKELEAEDRCFVYRFMTGTIRKPKKLP